MRVYLDPSVIVPALVEQANSITSRRLLAGGSTHIISDFAVLEVVSAIARLRRTRDLTEVEALETLSNLDLIVEAADERPLVETADVRLATALIRTLNLNLRAPDAIHLAIARRVDARLATFDARMAACATALGIELAAA